MWYRHELTQLITHADAIIDARQGRTRSVKVTNIFETSRRRDVLSFEYHANVVSFYFKARRGLCAHSMGGALAVRHVSMALQVRASRFN
jgi:hypothetical protein